MSDPCLEKLFKYFYYKVLKNDIVHYISIIGGLTFIAIVSHPIILLRKICKSEEEYFSDYLLTN